jgi:hypothetical protein
MALADRNIIITPNIGASSEPNILFRGADASSSATVYLRVYNSGTVGTISFEGNSGQLLSITDSMNGTIFSVNDVSGIPSIEVLDTGEIKLAEYNGYVNVKNTTNASSTVTGALRVSGGVGIGGNLWVGGTINGTASTATALANSLTFSNGGTGDASGSTYNGSAARTISYNSIGALGSSQKAADSNLLDGIDSASFLRSDVGDGWAASDGPLLVTTPAGSSGTTTGQVNTLQIYQATVNTDAFMTFHISGDYAAHFGLDGTTNDLFYGGWSAGAVKYKVIHTGNSSGVNIQFNSLGVNTAASGTAGEIRASNEITAYYTSDARLKENVRVISNSITLLEQIRGVHFDWTDDHIKSRGGEDGYFVRKEDIGVIAQEVEKVLPEIVATRDNGFKAVKYEKLVPLLIEAIKEQQTQLNKQQEKISLILKTLGIEDIK